MSSNHPVMVVARGVFRAGEREKYELDDAGAAVLERVLLDYKDDPELPAAILELFGLASVLHRDERSPAAAGRIFSIVGKLKRELTALKGSALVMNARAGESTRPARELIGAVRDPTPAATNTPAAATPGSMKIGNLSEFQRARTWMEARRPRR